MSTLRQFVAGHLDALNTLTKYPEIPTYHPLGERGMIASDEPQVDLSGEVIVTERGGRLVRELHRARVGVARIIAYGTFGPDCALRRLRTQMPPRGTQARLRVPQHGDGSGQSCRRDFTRL